MSKRGTYRLARGWMDNAVFREEPFCERLAFCWMIEQAAWKDCRRNINGKVIELRRGQFSHSLRYLAAAWRWSEASVRRFLNRLKNDAVIDAGTDAGQMLITLLKYDKYQSPLRDTDAASDAELDANLTQRRRRGDANENKGKKNEGNERGPARRRRQSQLPVNFEMPAEWLAWARQERPDLDAQRVAVSFVDHAHASGRLMADWSSAWKLWVRRETPRTGTAASTSVRQDRTNFQPTTQAQVESMRRANAELIRRNGYQADVSAADVRDMIKAGMLTSDDARRAGYRL